MNNIRKALEDFLNNSTPEQLAAELQKGNRPFLQTLEDPILLVSETKFSLPATVSFFQGEFAQAKFFETWDTEMSGSYSENEELSLAA